MEEGSEVGGVGLKLAVLGQDGFDGSDGGLHLQLHPSQRRCFENDFQGAWVLFGGRTQNPEVALLDDAAFCQEAIDDRQGVARQVRAGRLQGWLELAGKMSATATIQLRGVMNALDYRGTYIVGVPGEPVHYGRFELAVER